MIVDCSSGNKHGRSKKPPIHFEPRRPKNKVQSRSSLKRFPFVVSGGDVIESTVVRFSPWGQALAAPFLIVRRGGEKAVRFSPPSRPVIAWRALLRVMVMF